MEPLGRYPELKHGLAGSCVHSKNLKKTPKPPAASACISRTPGECPWASGEALVFGRRAFLPIHELGGGFRVLLLRSYFGV